MATWKSRGLRGSFFEDIINRTNEVYRERGTALVQKIPTPITPIDIDRDNRHITLAYFDRKSTVDYIGIAQGVALCFDCKECSTDTFALQNIHEHQYRYMKEFSRQGGVAFLLIYYSKRELVYFMNCEEVVRFYERGNDVADEETGFFNAEKEAKPRGSKSVRFDELNPKYLYEMPSEPFLNYLEFVNDYLEESEK
ncbi:MAG: Holliday junction resolvase RecU [Lachnospiraceae bacterium]|nr:Holliday junction resolvase RecU [Lachnospiraceae bacterium]